MDFCQEMVEIDRDEVLEATSRVIVGSGELAEAFDVALAELKASWHSAKTPREQAAIDRSISIVFYLKLAAVPLEEQVKAE